MAQSFLFYDLETFGLDTKADRIAQAAMIRTDMKLRIIQDPVVMMCSIAPDYLPTPSSCLITGITPQQTLREGIPEYEFITRIRDEFMVRDTIVLGYNSINFDDEFIRNCLYRNLYDPYEREWMNGCSRWDILDLVRAVHDFRPEGINFLHKKDNGATSFKLVHLTEDNNIPQEGAHDALVDVYATINVARLIREKQPALFDYYLRNRSKKTISAALDTVSMRPVLYTCQHFTSDHGSTRPIVPLTADSARESSIVCIDLTKDPEILLTDQAFQALIRVPVNRCPYIAPIGLARNVTDIAERLQVDVFRMDRKLSWIREYRNRIKTNVTGLMKEQQERFESEPAPSDPDLRIYCDSFLSKHDKSCLKTIHGCSPEARLRTSWHFDSDKLSKLLFRQVARNWPEVLSENEQLMWKSYCSTRLLQPFNSLPGYSAYMREISDKLESLGTTAQEKLVLVSLREYGQQLYEKIMH